MHATHFSWKHRIIIKYFLLSLFYVLLLAAFWPWYFDFIESRDGLQLNDFILNWLPAIDIAPYIFVALYAGILIAIYTNIKKPYWLTVSIFTYCFVTTLRIISIYFFPLIPPVDYVPLEEPFVKLFTNGGKIISHDLFFSGHVSAIFAFYFAMQKSRLKFFVLVLAIFVSIGVLVQHVHYTIDVLAAPIAAWLCFLLAIKVAPQPIPTE